jgi:hypothetical protein
VRPSCPAKFHRRPSVQQIWATSRILLYAFAIPVTSGVACHNPDFAAAAATEEAHDIALKCAKGLAMLAVRVLIQDGVAEAARRDFQAEEDDV